MVWEECSVIISLKDLNKRDQIECILCWYTAHALAFSESELRICKCSLDLLLHLGKFSIGDCIAEGLDEVDIS